MLMISSSPAPDPDTSEDEIAHFRRGLCRAAIASRRVHNLVGFLIWCVPQCFGGGISAQLRADQISLVATEPQQQQHLVVDGLGTGLLR